MLFYNDDKLVLTLSPRHETGLSTRFLGIAIALIYYIKLLLQFNSVYPVHRINGQAAVPICRPTIPIRPSCSANLQANKNTKQWPSCSAHLQTDKNAKQWPSCSANLQADKNTKQWPSCSANLQANNTNTTKLQCQSAGQQKYQTMAKLQCQSADRQKCKTMAKLQAAVPICRPTIPTQPSYSANKER